MRAAVYFGRHDVRIIDFQEPPLTDTGVKVAVSYCGLCGTDLHKYDGLGGSRPVIPPVVLGHEASGIVVETGRNVSGIHIGDRVCVDPNGVADIVPTVRQECRICVKTAAVL